MAWRLPASVDESASTEGVDEDGKVRVRATATPLDSGGYTIDISLPAPRTFTIDQAGNPTAEGASDPTLDALLRDLVETPLVDPSLPATDVAGFSLLSGVDPFSTDKEAPLPATTSDPNDANRRRLACAFVGVSEAYLAADGRPSLCGLEYQRALSTDVMKIWQSDDPADLVHHVAIGFAGTRFPDPGDILRDLQSLVFTTHESPLDPSTPLETMRVGAGWEARWQNQAATGIAAFLDEAAVTDRERGYRLQVHIGGHSLGGVTATLAGFDVAGLLAARGITHRVTVYAFNSPHLGYASARDGYQRRLFRQCTVGDYGTTEPCLLLYQFLRTGDPVHHYPLFNSHPTWPKEDQEDRRVGPGPFGADASLPYCSTTFTRRRSWWNPLANHELDSWLAEIGNLPTSTVDCIFAPH